MLKSTDEPQIAEQKRKLSARFDGRPPENVLMLDSIWLTNTKKIKSIRHQRKRENFLKVARWDICGRLRPKQRCREAEAADPGKNSRREREKER